MKNPAALLGRILLVAFVSAILTVAPAYAQHGGGGGHSGGGSSHGGGGGSHGGGGSVGVGGSHGGGGSTGSGGHSVPAGSVSGGNTGGMHMGGAPMPGPVMRGGSGSHSSSRSANWQPSVFVPPNTSAGGPGSAPLASTYRGPQPFVWQEPPAAAHSSHAAFAPPRRESTRPVVMMTPAKGMPVSAASAAPAAHMIRSVTLTTPPAGARVGSQVFGESLRQPRPVGFPRHRRFDDDDDFFLFGFGHHRFHSFGIFPFQTCFFNGFTSVCAFQPAFFSPFCFGPLGFGDVGWGWNGYGTGYQNTVAAQPVEEQPAQAETSASNDVSTYQPQAAQEPQPAEQAAEQITEQAPEQTKESPLVVLVLKDGSVYGVTDYWLEGGRLHYLASYGGANDIAIEQLDLQKTVDLNWSLGAKFVLRPATSRRL